MSNVRMVRKHASVLPWFRAVVFFGATLAALAALPFYPAAARPLIALVCAALGVFAPAVGVLVLVLVLALPLAAGDFLVGALFLLVGLASVQYLGQGGARAFVVVALAFLASLFKAEWALAPLAGYLLGASEGAMAVCVAVAVVEAAGLALGAGSTGVLATGGSKALVGIGELRAITDPLTFRWLAPAIAKLDVDTLLKTLSSAKDIPLLVLQPFLWALVAALTGSLTKTGAKLRSILAAGGGAILLAAASLGVVGSLGAAPATSAMALSAPISVVVALAVAAIAEYVFPRVEIATESTRSLRAEDADVDDLLRTIANAEEALEDRHATDATVLITDMKAFSRMTQEQGTVATAKAIQKHRDLLLPIVAKSGGHGKSTGGDGLLAAFASAQEALAAAVEMQRALKRYNDKKPAASQIQVRIGLASGDVIIDRSGCPFIGDALNLAARVMSLADGGQVFAAADVIDASSDLPSPVVSHGEFALKNITSPVNVYEVLWDEGQQPRRPELEPSAA